MFSYCTSGNPHPDNQITLISQYQYKMSSFLALIKCESDGEPMRAL